MKIALALVLALAACGGKSDPKTTPAGNPIAETPDDMVDPTLPSWAPRSCKAYHTVVVKAVECTVMDQAARDGIKAKYEASNTTWHDLQDAKQEQIDQIGASCADDAKAVRDQATGKCDLAAM